MSKWSKGCQTGSIRKLTENVVIDSSFCSKAKAILEWAVIEKTP